MGQSLVITGRKASGKASPGQVEGQVRAVEAAGKGPAGGCDPEAEQLEEGAVFWGVRVGIGALSEGRSEPAQTACPEPESTKSDMDTCGWEMDRDHTGRSTLFSL